MKMLRTFLVLLLCVMLPLSGLAATGLTGMCPMQQSAPMHDDASMPVEVPDCDGADSSPAGEGKKDFCKITAQCQFASIYYPPVRLTIEHPMAASNQVVFHYIESLSVREPGGLWRPPQAI